MTKRKTPFFFTFRGLSNSPIFQYLNFSFHRHFNGSSGRLLINQKVGLTKSLNLTTQDFYVHLVEKKNKENNSVLAGHLFSLLRSF